MEIEEFINRWIEGECRRFRGEIEEYEHLMVYLSDVGEHENE